MNFTHNQLKQAVADINYYIALLESKPLSGGISATTYELKVANNMSIRRWVFRAHSDHHRTHNPNITHDEHMLHVFIQPETSVPLPHPVYYGDNPDVFPVPYLITEYIEHDNRIPTSSAEAFASMLVNIHNIDLSAYDYSFLPDANSIIESQLQQIIEHPTFSLLQRAFARIEHNSSCLLHGDYWDGNILWDNNEIVAVIDWEDMMCGDPLADLGKSRLEFLWQFDQDMMQNYTQHYRSHMPQLDYTYLPFWDLWGAYRLRDFATWFEDTAKIRSMQEKYDRFAAHAIDGCKQFLS